MANKLMSMGLVIALVAAAVASMLHGSSAQTTHVVGDTTGWTIPTNGGASTYSTWASRNTFTVGDILGGTASPPSSGPAPTTPPSSTDTPPSVPSADSPPPSTAAPSIAIATLPLTFLSVALAFLY
nr:Cucumber peeling cupredoxin [Ipomoea batatas]